MDEDALVCDLAETYHIYDYRQLPANRVAVFVYGLRDNSRVKMLLSEQKVSFDTLLLASMSDTLRLLAWAKTKDGQKGLNRPASIISNLMTKEKERDEIVFDSVEDFEKTRSEILNRIRKGGN